MTSLFEPFVMAYTELCAKLIGSGDAALIGLDQATVVVLDREDDDGQAVSTGIALLAAPAGDRFVASTFVLPVAAAETEAFLAVARHVLKALSPEERLTIAWRGWEEMHAQAYASIAGRLILAGANMVRPQDISYRLADGGRTVILEARDIHGERFVEALNLPEHFDSVEVSTRMIGKGPH